VGGGLGRRGLGVRAAWVAGTGRKGETGRKEGAHRPSAGTPATDWRPSLPHPKGTDRPIWHQPPQPPLARTSMNWCWSSRYRRMTWRGGISGTRRLVGCLVGAGVRLEALWEGRRGRQRRGRQRKQEPRPGQPPLQRPRAPPSHAPRPR
jgi:hypothetical protein